MQQIPKINLGSQAHDFDRSSLQTTFLWTRQYSGGNVVASNAVFLEETPHEQTVFERLLHTVANKMKKGSNTDELKTRQWIEDEKSVREGTCSFQVQYLGSVEVPKSKGVQVCEAAVKYLKQDHKLSSGKKKDVLPDEHHWSTLHITSQLITVINDDTQNLIVEDTIKSISFCCSHRHYEKVFAYIVRSSAADQTPHHSRWICHAFSAITASGERINHALGCAFQICHENKLASNNNLQEEDELERQQSTSSEQDVEAGLQTQTKAATATHVPDSASSRPRPSSSDNQRPHVKFQQLDSIELGTM